MCKVPDALLRLWHIFLNWILMIWGTGMQNPRTLWQSAVHVRSLQNQKWFHCCRRKREDIIRGVHNFCCQQSHGDFWCVHRWKNNLWWPVVLRIIQGLSERWSVKGTSCLCVWAITDSGRYWVPHYMHGMIWRKWNRRIQMSSVINESMTSREMLDILVAKNMEDAKAGKKSGANSYVGQVLLRLVNFARQWVFILFTLKPCCGIIARKRCTGITSSMPRQRPFQWHSWLCPCQFGLYGCSIVSFRRNAAAWIWYLANICETLLKWYEKYCLWTAHSAFWSWMIIIMITRLPRKCGLCQSTV